MRDAQSKLDQVIAFTGGAITAEDVAHGASAWSGAICCSIRCRRWPTRMRRRQFALTARAVEMGYDFFAPSAASSRAWSATLLVLSVDPSRDQRSGDRRRRRRDRLKALRRAASRARTSLRAFDLLTRTEARDQGRGAAQVPHLEMALLRWMHLAQARCRSKI